MELIYYLWLENIAGCGLTSAAKLVSHLGSAEAVYNAKNIDAFRGIKNLSADTVKALIRDKDLGEAEKSYERIKKSGVNFITYEDGCYPFILKQIATPPTVLYYKGENIFASAFTAIAAVGTRRATPYGQSVAYRLCSQMAEAGICVVSGMAAGIDYCAHRGALSVGGLTIAVTGCGLDRIYPAENKELFYDIIDGGGMVISEFTPGTPPLTTNFPMRNRIISGISLGTLVVEAGFKSGSLITAAYASEQNREVYAVPGHITEPMSVGPNRLIKDGAKAVLGVGDILEELNMRALPHEAQTEDESGENLSSEESALVSAVKSGIQTPDALSRHLQIETARLSSMITMLELKKQLTYKLGKLYATYRR